MKRLFSICLVLLLSFVPMQAALDFSGTDDVDHGSAATLDQQSVWTKMFWLKATTLSDNNRIWGKGDPAHTISLTISPATELVANVRRGTGEDLYVTNNASLVTGTEYFLAISFDSASAANERFNVYLGTLVTPPVELTYVTTDEGSGIVGDDSAQNYVIGPTWEGPISWHGNWNRLLTLGEITTQWFRPHPTADNVIFTHYGFAGTGTQPDWSGNGNSGTVTGATVAEHVPLPQPF